ncbi:MAG TPA: serine/threonine-protein kinase [Chthoniobacterales bacterium]|jgi:tetratricopeptide (TPR) repeat protein/tRNA A-37 threonylcarbamoyl transferase component Bud32|nr:serine/threonine-protein kinase [Chthoniobacterales bacterium]
MPREGHAELVAELFKSAVELAPEHRATFLDEQCGSNRKLRAELESLFRAEDRAGQFMERPAADVVARTFSREGAFGAGQVVDGYEIVSLIGKGGMGEVYLAQDRRVRRQVALKLVRGGIDRETMARRFQREQELLAGLNHPNIAQLYDTGVTEDGIPYFVMEHVEGTRLDQFVEQRALGLNERLVLFRKLCAAVAYAHQNLVIHRDIKPGNIRVTPAGEPKLLDFGIAKLFDEMAADPAEQTVTMDRMLTPDYASPEQVRGERITTSTDVYSLGVVLYELLTGTKPHRLTSRRPEEITRTITEQAPPRPSSTAGPNARSLRGDLDNIVLMAMRKEPERRYRSTGQFAEDIDRYLEGRPVIARKDTFAYRAGKFIKRNKVAVAAAVLVFLSLAGGIIVASYEARRAQRRFDEVRRLANSLMFEIHDSVQDLQGSTPTRRLIVERALQYLDSLSQDGGTDSSLQLELATAYEKVGDIQGNPYTANLGDTEGALASYRKANAIRAGLSKGGAATMEARLQLARNYRAIGDIMELKGDVAECLKNYRNSLAIIEQLAALHPQEMAVQTELARAYETLGDGLSRTDEHGERLRAYQQTVSIRQALIQQTPDDLRQERGAAVAYMKVAGVAGVEKSEAVANMKRAISIFEKLTAADPQNARARRDLGYAHYQFGRILAAADDHAGALASRQLALQFRREIAAQDARNQQARFDLATAYGELAESYARVNAPRDALEHARQSLELLNDLTASDPANAVYRRNLGLCYERLARPLGQLAEDEGTPPSERLRLWQEARGWYQKALELFADLRDRGALMPSDAGQIENFRAQVAAADRAIAKLAPE